MSVAGISQEHHPDRNILMKKSFHRRNDSGELDVFEAARYFSGYSSHEAAAGSLNNGGGSSFSHHQKTKDDNRIWRSGGRMSLDMPMRHHTLNPQNNLHQVVTLDHIKVDKKFKQPSSPGGRLASFLNSLFNQSAARKKKSKPSSASSAAAKDDGRKIRRSSISHFRSSSTAATTTTTIIAAVDSRSIYSSSSSGFRTPPAYAQTPSKSYKEFKSFAKKNNSADIHDDDDDGNLMEEKNINTNEDDDDDDNDDDGADSDSSSDLFELQNYDLGCYSSGLPVYETTNMDKIKRGSAPISSASMC